MLYLPIYHIAIVLTSNSSSIPSAGVAVAFCNVSVFCFGSGTCCCCCCCCAGGGCVPVCMLPACCGTPSPVPTPNKPACKSLSLRLFLALDLSDCCCCWYSARPPIEGAPCVADDGASPPVLVPCDLSQSASGVLGSTPLYCVAVCSMSFANSTTSSNQLRVLESRPWLGNCLWWCRLLWL